MKKYYYLGCALLALSSHQLYAQSPLSITHYKNAKVAVQYHGSLGEFSQSLAKELDIPFYTEKTDFSHKIVLSQGRDKTIGDLLTSVNQQLANDQLRFDVLNDRITLVLVSNEIKDINPPRYIGKVEFETASIKAAQPQAVAVIETKDVPVELVVQDVEKKEVLDTTQQSVVNTQEVQPQTVEATKPLSVEEQEVRKEQAEKLQSIIKVSQDKRLIAQYSRRAQPIYDVDGKETIKLDQIRSTKISTFLIFEEGVDLSQYKFEGEFQDTAQLDNVFAILHRQQKPGSFKVVAPNGQVANIKLR